MEVLILLLTNNLKGDKISKMTYESLIKNGYFTTQCKKMWYN